MKRAFVVDGKEYNGDVISQRPVNNPKASELVRVSEEQFIHSDHFGCDVKTVVDYGLFANGTATVSQRTIDTSGKFLTSVTQFGQQWRKRYQYREALTVLCIGKFHRRQVGLDSHDIWRVIAKIVYNSHVVL